MKSRRYARLAKSGITVNGKCLRWQETYHDAPAPCTRLKKGEDRRKKKREVLHLFRCYTHAQRTHARTHTHTHTSHTTCHHTTYSHLLFHTQLAPHPTCSTPILHHLFSLSCFPLCHLYFTFLFSACWKKLTCGVIRSFSFAFAFCSDTDPQTYKIQVLFM